MQPGRNSSKGNSASACTVGCLKSWPREHWASPLSFRGSPSVHALVICPWDTLTSGTPQTEKYLSSEIPSWEGAYSAAGCSRALETWVVEEPDGWPGRKLSRFLMFGSLCKFHGNLGKIDSPCWDFAELVNSSEMLSCLKPSEQVQYLQLSFEDRQHVLLCFATWVFWESKQHLSLLLSPLPAFTPLKWCWGRVQELGSDKWRMLAGYFDP